jgi:uncharacterized protein (TIGR02118 family)
MTTKITVIFDNPESPQTFEAAYPDLVDRARKIPGVLRMETSKVWPKEDGTPTPAYRLIDLYLPDYDTASAAVSSPEAAEFFPRVFELATGGARAVFAEIEES